MSDFMAYMLAQSERKTAYADYNSSGRGLELAHIRERLAELKSQHEPLASLMEKPMTERDRLFAAAFWVVVGRLP